MLKYMKYFASLSREAGNLDLALKLEANTEKLIAEISNKTQRALK